MKSIGIGKATIQISRQETIYCRRDSETMAVAETSPQTTERDFTTA